MANQDKSASSLEQSEAGLPAAGQPDLYRNIPPVHELVDALAETGWEHRVGRTMIAEAVRRVLEDHRAILAVGAKDAEVPSFEVFIAKAAALLEASLRPPLAPVINATGIIIHTGLGRSPLAAAAVEAMTDVARAYAPVELELPTGERGKRATIVRDLLCEVTGAESATVVNNNTAALLIVLSLLAKDRSVIVSRGELIEIGGSFRLPDVIEAGGAILREVGTTNKTRASDYEKAIDDSTAVLLKMHTSNYRIEGFTQAASIEELVEIGRRHEVPVVHDVGSGVLKCAKAYGLPHDEPDVCSTVDAGADLVLFSGDKLLGGPQAGIIVGRRKMVERVEAHPMMRAMRVDKLTLAALGATLQIHRDPEIALREIPVLAAAAMPIAELETRARNLVDRLKNIDGVQSATWQASSAYIGGGSVPAQAIDSIAIELRSSSLSEDDLAANLRTAAITPVVSTVRGGSVWFDLRTVFPHQDDQLCQAIHRALRKTLVEPPTGG